MHNLRIYSDFREDVFILVWYMQPFIWKEELSKNLAYSYDQLSLNPYPAE